MSDIGAVIGWKHNHQSGMATADGVITEFPNGIPSAEDQATWTTEYEAHLAAIAYVDARVSAYPTIGDQLDALWKGGDDQAAMKVIVDKVKSDNPKPE
tara:strand:- start:15 stop:308 length:294 start_codon:yes stop_codon:yes gene_type:complete